MTQGGRGQAEELGGRQGGQWPLPASDALQWVSVRWKTAAISGCFVPWLEERP